MHSGERVLSPEAGWGPGRWLGQARWPLPASIPSLHDEGVLLLTNVTPRPQAVCPQGRLPQ